MKPAVAPPKKNQGRRQAQPANPKPRSEGKKALVSEALTKAGAKPKSCDNRYLCQLLDPESYGPSAYPDQFGDQTTTSLFIFNDDVPIDPTTGEFGIIVSPTLPDHVKMLTNVSGSTAQVYKFDAQWGSKDTPMVINSSLTTINWGRATASSIFLYTDEKVELQVDDGWILLPPYAPGTLKMQMPNSLNTMGTFSQTPGTVAAAVVGSDNSVTALPANTLTTLPDNLTKIKFQISAVQGPVNLLLFPGTSANPTIQFTTAATGTQQWQKYRVADYDNLAGSDDVQAVYTNYRVVALTSLLTYKGDTIYDGGTLAGRYMEGGSTCFDQGFVDYDSLAKARGSYDGRVKTGAYGWWKPRDTIHMAFRAVETENETGSLPHMVFMGKMTTAVLTSAKLRLRTAMVIEASTTTMFVPVTFSRVAPWEIEATDLVVQNLPRIMENPLHLAAIRDFLRQVVAKGREVTAAVKPYLPAMMKVASVVAPMLGI